MKNKRKYLAIIILVLSLHYSKSAFTETTTYKYGCSQCHVKSNSVSSGSPILGIPRNARSVKYPASSRPPSYPTNPKPYVNTTSHKPVRYPASPKPPTYPNSPIPSPHATNRTLPVYPVSPKPVRYPSSPKPVRYPSSPKPVRYPSSPTPVRYPASPKPPTYPNSPMPSPHPTNRTLSVYPSSPKPVRYPSSPKSPTYPTSPMPSPHPTNRTLSVYPSSPKPVRYPASSTPTYPSSPRPNNRPSHPRNLTKATYPSTQKTPNIKKQNNTRLNSTSPITKITTQNLQSQYRSESELNNTVIHPSSTFNQRFNKTDKPDNSNKGNATFIEESKTTTHSSTTKIKHNKNIMEDIGKINNTAQRLPNSNPNITKNTKQHPRPSKHPSNSTSPIVLKSNTTNINIKHNNTLPGSISIFRNTSSFGPNFNVTNANQYNKTAPLQHNVYPSSSKPLVTNTSLVIFPIANFTYPTNQSTPYLNNSKPNYSPPNLPSQLPQLPNQQKNHNYLNLFINYPPRNFTSYPDNSQLGYPKTNPNFQIPQPSQLSYPPTDPQTQHYPPLQTYPPGNIPNYPSHPMKQPDLYPPRTPTTQPTVYYSPPQYTFNHHQNQAAEQPVKAEQSNKLQHRPAHAMPNLLSTKKTSKPKSPAKKDIKFDAIKITEATKLYVLYFLKSIPGKFWLFQSTLKA